MPHRVRDTVQASSCAGLTRASIALRKRLLQKMDGGVKPGHDAIERLRSNRLLGGRDRRDRLQDLRGDGVGVALRVRAAVFEIAPVGIVLDERVRYADRGAAVGHAIAELVPGRSLVLAGQ